MSVHVCREKRGYVYEEAEEAIVYWPNPELDALDPGVDLHRVLRVDREDRVRRRRDDARAVSRSQVCGSGFAAAGFPEAGLQGRLPLHWRQA